MSAVLVRRAPFLASTLLIVMKIPFIVPISRVIIVAEREFRLIGQGDFGCGRGRGVAWRWCLVVVAVSACVLCGCATRGPRRADWNQAIATLERIRGGVL
jgi:hypothetical protein